MNPMAEENIYGTEKLIMPKMKYSTEVDYLYYCCPYLVPLLPCFNLLFPNRAYPNAHELRIEVVNRFPCVCVCDYFSRFQK